MQENVGKPDAVIRLLLGIGLFVVAAIFNAAPVVSLAAALGGIIMVGTALTKRCPLYGLFGLSTCPRTRAR